MNNTSHNMFPTLQKTRRNFRNQNSAYGKESKLTMILICSSSIICYKSIASRRAWFYVGAELKVRLSLSRVKFSGKGMRVTWIFRNLIEWNEDSNIFSNGFQSFTGWVRSIPASYSINNLHDFWQGKCDANKTLMLGKELLKVLEKMIERAPR